MGGTQEQKIAFVKIFLMVLSMGVHRKNNIENSFVCFLYPNKKFINFFHPLHY